LLTRTQVVRLVLRGGTAIGSDHWHHFLLHKGNEQESSQMHIWSAHYVQAKIARIFLSKASTKTRANGFWGSEPGLDLFITAKRFFGFMGTKLEESSKSLGFRFDGLNCMSSFLTTQRIIDATV
jgi:hypothetical protein